MSSTHDNPAASDAAPRGVWRLVAQREISVKLRDRNFLISTAVTILAIVASLGISGFLSGRTETIDLAVTGPNAGQVVELAGTLAHTANAKVDFVAHEVPDGAAVEDKVRSGSVKAGLAPDQKGWRLIEKTAKNDKADTYLSAAAQQLAIQQNAAAAGVSTQQLARGGTLTEALLEPNAIDPGLAKAAGFVFAFLFYLSSVLFGLSIAQSVVEEKQNRIVEILASAIPLRQLLIGKVLGNAAMALGQLVLFVGAGLIGLAAIGKGDQVAQIGGAAGWFVVFFVVGFLALASLWAVAGALATRTEDLQSTSTPLTMLIMIVLFAGIFLSGTALRVGSYIPLASVVAMPGRLAAGTASWWEPVIALVIMAAVAYGIVVVAEKIYRRSLMQTQGRLTIRQALALED
ncbi:ABC transporter permease [Nocardia yunnanensis]|uniref:ABC transporter permease n=1 Tax=Nocardia yunnanensis TaxID=2382165 RepID=A0A386ZB96_9NOCA|nr:ABC transporter permease [Nocardia yunnanensis]AYF74766.1 ABC transporter permease [Nocardia yunnanensis]